MGVYSAHVNHLEIMNNVHRCDFISSSCNLTPPNARCKTSPTTYTRRCEFTSRSCNLSINTGFKTLNKFKADLLTP